MAYDMVQRRAPLHNGQTIQRTSLNHDADALQAVALGGPYHRLTPGARTQAPSLELELCLRPKTGQDEPDQILQVLRGVLGPVTAPPNGKAGRR